MIYRYKKFIPLKILAQHFWFTKQSSKPWYINPNLSKRELNDSLKLSYFVKYILVSKFVELGHGSWSRDQEG